jgi:predicted amidohydrolase YtcJ
MKQSGQLYTGGDILTMDTVHPKAEALAVKAGVIIEVGTVEECTNVLGSDYEKIDLSEGALLPGFIDTHLHSTVMVFYEMNADLGGIGSLKELITVLHEASNKGAPESWLVGLNFDEQKLTPPLLPSRHDLDAACPNRPLIILRHDAHLIIANTRAIEAMGITAATPDPPAGVIDREENGYPAGVFRETMAQQVLSAMPMPDMDIYEKSGRDTFKKLAAYGITSAGIVLQTGAEGPAGTAGTYDVLAMQLLLPHVPVNLYGLLITDDPTQVEAARQTGLHKTGLGGNRIGGVKFYADGAFGSCTAFMKEPYSDHPETKGLLMHAPGELYRRMLAAHLAGLQICVHAIGDGANRICAELFSSLLAEHPLPGHRHRIEHASILDEETIALIARLKLVVSTQPMFIHSEKHWLHKRLGPERAKRTYPFRSMIDAGILLAGASDAPIESPDVLHAIECCVTREGFETGQGITVMEALRMFTIDAAYAQFEETVKGSLTPGKRADMVILSHNPLAVPINEIHSISVEKTIVGGVTIYTRT